MTSPVCVLDSFHFSHYYWSDAAYKFDDEVEAEIACEDDTNKTSPVKKDRINLKFYANVLGDGEFVAPWDNATFSYVNRFHFFLF